MNTENAKEAIKALLEGSKKRKFKQTFDLILNLTGLDMKKTDQQVEQYTTLHYSKGKLIKICAFVGHELREEAEKVCDKTIFVEELADLAKDKKQLKKIAQEYSFFIAQANIMPKVAQAFGKVLGTRGKMPNPKAGCVVPPKTQLKPLYDRLQKTAVLRAKTQPVIKVAVGLEDQNVDEVADNIVTVYTSLTHKLPNEANNIKSVLLKLTMSKPVEVK